MEREVSRSSGRQASAVSSIRPQGFWVLRLRWLGCSWLDLGFGSNVKWRWVKYLMDCFLIGQGATASTLRLRSSGLPSAVSTVAGLRWCVSFGFSKESPYVNNEGRVWKRGGRAGRTPWGVFLTWLAEAEQTWLILPVVICLSQRLSHACLSINFYMVKLRMAH